MKKFYTVDDIAITGNDELYLSNSIKDAVKHFDFYGDETATLYEVTVKPLKKFKYDIVEVPLTKTKSKTKGKKK